MREDIM